jgi:hypothetical protein
MAAKSFVKLNVYTIDKIMLVVDNKKYCSKNEQIVDKLAITSLSRVLKKCPCKAPGDQIRSKKLH